MSCTLATEVSASLRERAEQLAKLELDYRFHESFRGRGVKAELLGESAVTGESRLPKQPPPKPLPAHLGRLCARPLLTPDEERQLFRRLNYAKYRADLLRRKLDPNHPDEAVIQQIESLLAIANHDRNEIVLANVRLAVSIAKKFAGVNQTFDELLSEGIETLLRAVDKFDFGRGFRFSTYATTALRHSLLRVVQKGARDHLRFQLGQPDLLAAAADVTVPTDAADERQREQRCRLLARLIRRLDVRERHIIARRFGLDASGSCQTLQSLAGELGICKERVRQLEIRACDKIRKLAQHENVKLIEPTSEDDSIE